MKILLRILAALLACASCASAPAAVTTLLDRDHIAMGDTVRLLVQSDGNTDGEPDIAPLSQDFDVLGSSRSTSLQIVNGHSSSQTQLSLILAPKHAGTLRIPPLQWGGQQSQPLELTVGGNAGSNNASGGGSAQDTGSRVGSDAVFLTVTPDDKQPYVQQPVVLSVRIHTSVPIDQASLDLPGNSDMLVKQIGKDRQSSELRNGRNYQVIERRYLLIPQRSGQISLKGPVLDAQVQDPGSSVFPDLDTLLRNAFGRNPLGGGLGITRPLHLAGHPVELKVLPRPAASTGANWLPAQKLKLEQSWRPEHGPLHVGEPLTRHLHLSAVGLTGAQLPDLGTLVTAPDGIKTYPDQAKVKDDTAGDTITGSRDQDIAFIASKPGHYVLPALKLSWWDTTGKTQREAVLPARTLDILPANGQPSTPAAAPPPAIVSQPSIASPATTQAPPLPPSTAHTDEPPWQWISAALGLLWLGTVCAWWYSARRMPKALSAKVEPVAAKPTGKPAPAKPAAGALSALQRACRDNDAQAARRHLLEWAAGFWPDSPPRGLNAIARRLDDDRFADPLKELDRACYTGDTWQGDSLAQAFAAVPRQTPSQKTVSEIPDLYS